VLGICGGERNRRGPTAADARILLTDGETAAADADARILLTEGETAAAVVVVPTPRPSKWEASSSVDLLDHVVVRLSHDGLSPQDSPSADTSRSAPISPLPSLSILL
jgi:hypothetical protein